MDNCDGMILIRKRLDIPQNGAKQAIILEFGSLQRRCMAQCAEPQKKSGMFPHKFGINFDQRAQNAAD